MTTKKAKRIGIIFTMIFSFVGVFFFTTALFLFMNDSIEFHFFSEIINILDITIPATILSAYIFAQRIGEEVIIQKQDDENKVQHILFITISVAFLISFIYTLVVDSYSISIEQGILIGLSSIGVCSFVSRVGAPILLGILQGKRM